MRDQAGLLDTYLKTQQEIAGIIMGYQRKTPTVNAIDLDRACVATEVAEAEPGLLEAKRMATVVHTLTSQQKPRLLELTVGS